MNGELILNALASNDFQSLRNNGDGWTLTYCDENGETKSRTDATLDNLIEWWSRRVDQDS